MKCPIIFLFFFILLSTKAANQASSAFMSIEAQESKVEKIAKAIRRNYWRSGHEDVSSHEFFVTKAALDEHTTVSNYENSLASDEVAQLYKCHYSRSCELYQVNVGGSYWGGYGTSAHFVLLYTKSGKHFEISHITYAE